jgi:hypothetical protein
VYWIRNIIYHAPGGSTRMTSGAAGVLFCNNTILTETSAGASANVHWRNHLFLGENSSPAISSVTTNDNYSSSDYNGFRLNPGAATAFQWTSPPWSNVRNDGGPAAASAGRGGGAGNSGGARDSGGTGDTGGNRSFETRRFASLAAYAAGTRRDEHSVLVDYDVFVNVPRLDAKDLPAAQRLAVADAVDFRLRAGSAAVDRGVVLRNVTDDFSGTAPDLGALEMGQSLPVYGPRQVPKP